MYFLHIQGGGYALSSRISQLSVPTMVMWGDNDNILGTDPANKFASDIASAELVWVPSCGHVPHLEQADFTSEKLRKFNEKLNEAWEM